MAAPRPIRVLVVDDSATVRAVLRRLLRSAGDIEVVGEAANGAEAIQDVVALQPDIVLMDIEMPVMSGFVASEHIMDMRPTPIVMITSRANREEVSTAFEALRRGALEVIAKPEDPPGWEALAATLPATVRSLTQSWVRPGQPRRGSSAPGAEAAPIAGGALGFVPPPTTCDSNRPPAPEAPALRLARLRYVGVGASTGGPGAVRELLAGLPAELPAAVLIVQHIAAGFEEGFAEWLTHDLGRDVHLARDGESARAGTIVLAPPGGHLRLTAGGALQIDASTPPRGPHRPSADELFRSLACAWPYESAGVLLTGMGSDGAEGLLALRRAGGLTIAQDEASSVVFGMPRAALQLGAAELALPPREIAARLARCWRLEAS